MKIEIETTVKASLNSVWNAWNNPEDMSAECRLGRHTTWHRGPARRRTFLSRMEARDGSAGFDFEGTYTTPPRQLIEYR